MHRGHDHESLRSIRYSLSHDDRNRDYGKSLSVTLREACSRTERCWIVGVCASLFMSSKKFSGICISAKYPRCWCQASDGTICVLHAPEYILRNVLC